MPSPEYRVRVSISSQEARTLRRSGRPDLRCTYWLRHPEEDHDTLSAAPGRKRFVRNAEAAIDVLPIIHDPNVARRSDGKIGLHLKTPADIAARWRNLVSRLHSGRAIFCTDAAQLRNWAIRSGKVRNPD